MKIKKIGREKWFWALVLGTVVLAAGCSGFHETDEEAAAGPSYRYALVTCADWAGQNSLAAIQLKPAAAPFLWMDWLVNLGSDPFLDPVVRTKSLTSVQPALVLEREYFSATGLGEVAVLNPANRFQVEATYPVNDGVNPANPNDLLVLSADKAYVTRWDWLYNDILILNPDTGATSGTIDFTGMGANADGLPRLYKMLYLQGRVWVLMQNINAFFTEYGPGSLGVVNPQSDVIEDIIALDLKNPADFGYDGELNRLYVAATGDWFDPSGAGVEAVNPASRISLGVLIQGSDLGGFLTHMAFQDAGHAYLSVTNSDFISGDQVIQVNPAAGTIGKTLYAYPGLYVSDLALDRQQDLLLIADNTGSRVVVIDLKSGLIVDTVETLVPPVSIAIWEGEDKL